MKEQSDAPPLPETEQPGRHTKARWEVYSKQVTRTTMDHLRDIEDPGKRREAMMDEMWQGLTRQMSWEGVMLHHHTLREPTYG